MASLLDVLPCLLPVLGGEEKGTSSWPGMLQVLQRLKGGEERRFIPLSIPPIGNQRGERWLPRAATPSNSPMTRPSSACPHSGGGRGKPAGGGTVILPVTRLLLEGREKERLIYIIITLTPLNAMHPLRTCCCHRSRGEGEGGEKGGSAGCRTGGKDRLRLPAPRYWTHQDFGDQLQGKEIRREAGIEPRHRASGSTDHQFECDYKKRKGKKRGREAFPVPRRREQMTLL